MKYKRTVMSVTFDLTKTELRERGHDLAKSIDDLDRLKSEKVATMEKFKNEIDEADAKIEHLTKTILSEKEDRVVEVLLVPDFGSNRILYTLPDGGAIVKERAMTEEELQGSLPMDDDDEEEGAGPSSSELEDNRGAGGEAE